MTCADFALIAHRGFSSQAPENTFAAFDLAIDNGYAAIELDVQLTADGVPVVLHDGELRRVAGGRHIGSINRLSAAEAASIDVGSHFGSAFAGQRIPRLDDVLRRYSGRTHLHVELKSTQAQLPAAVAAAIQACGGLAERDKPASGRGLDAAAQAGNAFAIPGLTITSFHLQQLRASAELLPGVRHGWLVQHIDDNNLKAAAAAGLHGIYPRANAATAAATAAAITADFSVRAWGVKNVELLRHVHECGVQGATVDWPDVARAAVTSSFEGIGAAELQLDD